MVLATTPILVGAQLSFYTWSSRANPAYRYPYAVENIGDRPLHNEIEFYQERISRNPSDGMDRAALASVYLNLARSTGDASYFHAAEESAQQSLANLPVENTAAQLVLARVAEAEHDFPTTFKIVQQILTTQPTHSEAQSLLVTSYLAIGKLPEAQQAVQRLVEQAPNLATYSLEALVHDAQGQDEQAIQAFQQALAAEEPGEVASSAKTRTLLGRFYTQRGQVKQARGLFQEALRIAPQNALALVEQAKLETQQGNYQQAEDLYAQVLGSSAIAHSLDHQALLGQASLKLLQGDRNAAIPLWAKAEQNFRHHHHQEAEHTHGGTEHTHEDTGHAHEHRKTSEPVEDHESEQNFGHRRDLARLLLTRGQPADITEALELMQTEAQIRRDAETLETFAWALQLSNQEPAAQKVLQEAISLGTREARLFYRAGMVEQALGNKTQAQLYFQMAQEVNPSFDIVQSQRWELG